MDQALAVFDDDAETILQEAADLAAGVDASLTVLALMTEDEFEEARETLDAVAKEEHTGYGNSVALDAAVKEARDAVADYYRDLDLDWDVDGTVISDESAAAEAILEVADEIDADHVFLSGQRRSPTGKAVFGDRAQAVILNFDGPVTTLLE